MNQHDRRLSADDRARVAIARGQLPPDTDVNDPKLNLESSDNPARVDLVRAVLSSSELKLLERLKVHGPLKVYLLAPGCAGVDEASRASNGPGEASDASDASESRGLTGPAGLNADEPQTALADAINEVLVKAILICRQRW